MASKLSALLALAAAPLTLAEPASLRGSVREPVVNSSVPVALTPGLLANSSVPVALNASSPEIVEIEGVEEVEDWGDSEDANETILETSAGLCPHSDQVIDPSSSCAASANTGCASCYLYRACHGPPACVVNGYLVVPGSPLRGTEDINRGNAGSWDFLFSVAKGHCGAETCVLITNPIHYRTQHQMHLHYRHLNTGGLVLKGQLESALCGTSGWQAFSKCGPTTARLFDEMPGVLSSVAEAYPGDSLADVGITVWFTTACGDGLKTMILLTTECSIEHSISSP